MSKDGSLTSGERVFILSAQINKLNLRIKEIDGWLSTAGLDLRTNQDRKIKRQFLEDRAKLVRQLDVLKEQVREIQVEHEERRAKRKLQANEASSFEAAERVTDHALVRWLERVHGINIREMKDALYAEATEAWKEGRVMARDGKGIRATKGEMVYVLDAVTHNVVTVYSLSEKDSFNR